MSLQTAIIPLEEPPWVWASEAMKSSPGLAAAITGRRQKKSANYDIIWRK
ncbi:hypothetical protein ACFLVB_01935 [Chloroflexota bacterium]